MQSYLNNGGIAFSQCSNNQLAPSLLRSTVSLEAVQDCLILQSDPWLPEDLAINDVWLIGTLARTYDSFKKLVEEYLDSFRSPYYTAKRHLGTSTFESVFGIQKIVSQVKNASPHSRSQFFDLLRGWGNPLMFQPFVDGGIDVNEWGTWWIYLGQAACKQNLENLHTLDVSYSGFQALLWFLKPKRLVPGYEQLLPAFLDDNVSLAGSESHDPFLAMTKSKKSLRVYPQALNMLLSDGYCKPWSLHGGTDVLINESYMYLAIRYGRPDAVQIILDHGARVNVQIGDLFVVYEFLAILQLYTWLTLAVERGDASCTEVLIKHGASIHSPDGLGRSALELARLNVASAHPRLLKDYTFTAMGDSSTLEADMETLGVLERALATTPSCGMYLGTCPV